MKTVRGQHVKLQATTLAKLGIKEQDYLALGPS
jgi:hypothetical protein